MEDRARKYALRLNTTEVSFSFVNLAQENGTSANLQLFSGLTRFLPRFHTMWQCQTCNTLKKLRSSRVKLKQISNPSRVSIACWYLIYESPKMIFLSCLYFPTNCYLLIFNIRSNWASTEGQRKSFWRLVSGKGRHCLQAEPNESTPGGFGSH
jgi:hypothetical protein